MNPTIKNTLKTLSLFAIVIFGLSAQTQAGVFVPPADGTPDFQFEPNANGAVRAIAVQDDGKILLGGNFTALGTDDPMSTRNRIARLNADGTIDNDFAVLDVNGEVFAIAVQSNGDILFGGNFTMVGTATRNHIARVDTNGILDDDFDPNVDGMTVDAIVLQMHEGVEKILIGGSFNTVGSVPRSSFARLELNGDLDDDFNLNVTGDVRVIAVTPDNEIFIAGQFSNVGTETRDNIARLDADGVVDTSFNAGFLIGTITQGNDEIESLAIQPDGRIVIGGAFASVAGVERNHVTRLNTDGSLDMSFDAVNFDDSAIVVAKVVLQPDGKILIGGFFTDIEGQAMITNLARLNSDGSLDTSFTPGVSSIVDAIAIQPADDNILVGGNFTSIDNGLPRNNIARLENTVPPPEVNIATNAVVLPEGRTGQKAFNFDVSLSFSSNRPSSVQYTVSAGATQPSADANDFANAEFATGTLDFPVGAPTQTISVMVAGDTDMEEDETFTLTLSNPNNATLGTSISAQGTIVDDEDDILCLPIPARNGNFAVVCL